ncbi:hypothetical protein D9758_018926 [Tetrapyrgos nigripes]|uniref:beta-glucosidase n=1 Tax=Tetrapyrgos nigripes TaxID=182062 RepID=A0A8H5AUX6_9AGAR|nr:hypothetical protein D9758_018926 [Tetrapyrgos nigripes]
MIGKCLHGVGSFKQSMFPLPIGLAASWDEDLVWRMGRAVGSEARSVGIHACLCPVLDLGGFRAFQSSVEEGRGRGAIMAYHEFNSIPAHINPFFYDALNDPADTISQWFNAGGGVQFYDFGLDLYVNASILEFFSLDLLLQTILSLLSNNTLSLSTLQSQAKGVLNVKWDLGLFDSLLEGDSSSALSSTLASASAYSTWGGRPFAIPQYYAKAAAVLNAFFPSQSGSQAITDVLFGAFNPGGRIILSVQYDVGSLPVYYNYHSMRHTLNYTNVESFPYWPKKIVHMFGTFGKIADLRAIEQKSQNMAGGSKKAFD